MRYLAIYTPANQAGPTDPHDNPEMAAFMEESNKKGQILDGGGLMPVSQGGLHIRNVGGVVSSVDGPFTETKEVVAGFAILQFNSTEEMIENSRRFLELAGEGECVVRPLMGPDGQ